MSDILGTLGNETFNKDSYIQWIHSIPLRLKSYFDLSFIDKYGKVFKVFDDQDSGNLCFGVHNGGKRYFIKFAGAPTVRYDGEQRDTIHRLKATAPIYRDLAHPNLIKLIGEEETGTGYAVIFDWVDAECMGRISSVQNRSSYHTNSR